MENGKRMSEKDMELIIIRTETDTKVTGIMIFKVELEHIIIQMAIFTKDSG